MTFAEFLRRISNGEDRGDHRTIEFEKIEFPLCNGLPTPGEYPFRRMKLAVRRDADQLGRLLEEMEDFDLYQPAPVIPRQPMGDEEFQPCRKLAVHIHADGEISLQADFDSIDASVAATLASTYGFLLLTLAAVSKRKAKRLVISFAEAAIFGDTPAPEFLPVAVTLGKGTVAHIVTMTWADVVIESATAK